MGGGGGGGGEDHRVLSISSAPPLPSHLRPLPPSPLLLQPQRSVLQFFKGSRVSLLQPRVGTPCSLPDQLCSIAEASMLPMSCFLPWSLCCRIPPVGALSTFHLNTCITSVPQTLCSTRRKPCLSGPSLHFRHPPQF